MTGGRSRLRLGLLAFLEAEDLPLGFIAWITSSVASLCYNLVFYLWEFYGSICVVPWILPGDFCDLTYGQSRLPCLRSWCRGTVF